VLRQCKRTGFARRRHAALAFERARAAALTPIESVN
jgi:hypothetical protein